MTYHLTLQGLEDHKVEARSGGWFSSYKLYIDGQLAPKGPKRGQMLIRRSGGDEVVAFWKPKALGFDVPQLLIDGQTVNLVQPLQWYEYTWCGLPIFMIFVGGALGGLLGGLAFTLNVQIFRMNLEVFLKFLFTAAISMLAALLYLFVGFLLFAPSGT